MAISGSTVWEVRTTGSDNNGGGYNAFRSGATTDYSQQAAAQASYTDLAIPSGNTSQLTSATRPFVAADIGNHICITGGTGFTVSIYEIQSVSGGTATLDRAVGTASSTGGTGNLGGAHASPARPNAFAADSNRIWVRSGTYTITTATQNVAGGCPLISSGVVMTGYGTTRGDFATRPVLQASGITGFTVISFVGQRSTVDFIEVDGAGLTTSRGFAAAGLNCVVLRCLARNCTNSGFYATAGALVFGCHATGCTTQPAFGGSSGMTAFYCVAYGNTAIGFGSNVSVAVHCISAYNTRGFDMPNAFGCFYVNCVAYGGSEDGFVSNGIESPIINCVSYGNTGRGFTEVSSAGRPRATLSIASGGNGSANTFPAVASLGTNGDYVPSSVIALTADPFTNAAAGDFSLNAVAGGGALLRAAGWPSTLGTATPTKTDIGAAQVLASALSTGLQLANATRRASVI